MLVRFRVDGVLRDQAPIDKRLQNATAARVKVMAQLDIAEKRMPQDGSFVVYIGGNAVDVRAAVLPTKHGEQVVLRVLQRETKLELPDLGMSPEMENVFMQAIEQPHGAVISCGPTGSGKTTTLYAALDRLNDGLRSIATIEDPVEYQLPGVMQMEVHTKINLTFGRGLRTILRADPEVILVGEVRDEETAKIAIQAAMTGHLVLTTLHTNDAASAIARLRTLGVDLRSARRLDQLHRLAAPRAPHLHALPRGVRAVAGAADLDEPHLDGQRTRRSTGRWAACSAATPVTPGASRCTS